MKKLFKDRLLKLATHLESGELTHLKFDFNEIHKGFIIGACCEEINLKELVGKYLPKNICGTSGCAMGEIPAVWPKFWKWNGDGIQAIDGVTTVTEFFGLSDSLSEYDEEDFLFYPDRGTSPWGTEFDVNTTKEEVAAGIRAFVKYKEKA